MLLFCGSCTAEKKGVNAEMWARVMPIAWHTVVNTEPENLAAI